MRGHENSNRAPARIPHRAASRPSLVTTRLAVTRPALQAGRACQRAAPGLPRSPRRAPWPVPAPSGPQVRSGREGRAGLRQLRGTRCADRPAGPPLPAAALPCARVQHRYAWAARGLRGRGLEVRGWPRARRGGRRPPFERAAARAARQGAAVALAPTNQPLPTTALHPRPQRLRALSAGAPAAPPWSRSRSRPRSRPRRARA